MVHIEGREDYPTNASGRSLFDAIWQAAQHFQGFPASRPFVKPSAIFVCRSGFGPERQEWRVQYGRVIEWRKQQEAEWLAHLCDLLREMGGRAQWRDVWPKLRIPGGADGTVERAIERGLITVDQPWLPGREKHWIWLKLND